MNKQQLANRIWASANKMRSKIEANEYKDYILGLIFYKFLSDNEVNYLKNNAHWEDEDIKCLVEDYDDAEATENINYCKENIGYFIEYKNLFSTWLLPESTFSVADLSAALSSFNRLVSPTYKPVYEGIFNTLQTGLSKLGENPASQTKALKALIKLIKDIPTDGSQDYDVLGYVYEFLIGNFAASAGKKAGEFYTPHEVAILMSEIVAEHHKAKSKIEIYDPTSGSGSLLITIGKSIGRHIADKNKVKYYAQELKENTYNLTRMNLVMRGIQPGNINTRCADSLDEDWPVYKAGSEIGQPLYVDAVVSNPPYSQHWDPTDADMDARFQEYGVAPKSKADYAFLLHELHHLKPDGILTIVLPHGVLFRGNAEDDGEGKIRKNLIEKNNIDAIIGLPANIFFGTGIPTLVMVLKQHRDNDDVLIIDASKGFIKDGKQNKLRACDVKKIADTVRDRATIPGFSRTVSRDEIRANGYNLNIPRYVDSSDKPEQYDIYATMFGGIPMSEVDALQEYWTAFPTLRDQLFAKEADKPYCRLKCANIKETIESNGDVQSAINAFNAAFDGFVESLRTRLITNCADVQDKKDQDAIAEDIFKRMASLPLLDKYAAYEVLATRWSAIMSDIETLQTEGMEAARIVEDNYKVVKKDDEEVEVVDGRKGRVIPFNMVQRAMFGDHLKAIANGEERLEQIAAELDELRDSFDEDEQAAYLDEDDNAKFNKNKIKADAKPRADVEPETKEKLVAIKSLWDEQSSINKAIKAIKLDLAKQTEETIKNLTDEQVAEFLDSKWVLPVCIGIEKMMRDTLAELKRKISALAAKYETSYNDINASLNKAETALSALAKELTGDEWALKGLNEQACLQLMFPQPGETTPRIRFKGFEGDWKCIKLSDILEERDEKSKKTTEYPLMAFIANQGVAPKGDKYDRSALVNDVENKLYKKTEYGDFIYSSNNLETGSIGLNTYGKATISPVYNIFRCKEGVNYDFIGRRLVCKDIIAEMVKWRQGVVYGQWRIHQKDFLSINILLPSNEEQRKIGEFLKNLDRQIALQEQRLEKLKQVKAACLDNMFV